MPRSEGRRSSAVGAVVWTTKEIEVELDGLLGEKMHVDSLGRPVQLYDTGRRVDELVPLVTTNPVELVTVRFTAVVFPLALPTKYCPPAGWGSARNLQQSQPRLGPD